MRILSLSCTIHSLEPTRHFKISSVQFTCLDMGIQEDIVGLTNHLGCAHACIRHTSCFMFRYGYDGSCALIGEGDDTISDLSDLYKII